MRTMTPILSLVFLASLAPACAPPPPKAAIASDAPSAPVKVATTVAETEQIPRLLPLTGTLEPNAESAVAANASGQVVRVFVERGSVVVKGAPLVQLDTRLSSLSAAEAQANLESIRTQKVQADTDCERNRRLLERQAITAVEFEKADSSCKVQQQQLAAAESRLRQAAVAVGNATIRAPFAGVVRERTVNVGEYVNPAAKVVHLVQTDPIRVELTAGEADAAAIKLGQTLQFEVKALPGRSFTATVRYVAPSLRAASRDLIFEAVCPNPDGVLKPGMFATATLEIGTEPSVVVARSALRKDGETMRAFVVKDRHIEERVVHVARDMGERAAIKAGISGGERIVAGAIDGLKDGLEVQN